MNTLEVIRAIGKHELLIYNEESQIYVPNGRLCYTDKEVDAIIETLIRTKELYLKYKKSVELYEQELKKEASKELDIATYNLMNKKKKSRSTNLYVMIDHHTGHYKIGRSDSPTKREATLLSQKSSIELLFFFPGTINQEKMLHEIFKNKWVRGEWFELANKDLILLKKIGGLL
jgi:hypothetical protein